MIARHLPNRVRTGSAIGAIRAPKLARALAAAAAIVALVAGCAPADAPRVIWRDEFTGPAGTAPDAKSWSYETGGAGWGNDELECYTDAPGNVALDGAGHLVITARKQPGHVCVDGKVNDYTSARILTHTRFATKYGRLAVRAKLPNTSGTWPAFWALGENIDRVGWPRAGETDVVEAIGSKPGWIVGTLHGPKPDETPFQISRSTQTDLDLSAAFHVYAADWTSDRVTFSMDGKAYGSVTRAQVEDAGGQWVWDKDFYLLLNLAVGGRFPGWPDADAPWPQEYTIDWVRVYR